MSTLDNLYREIIMEHYKNPRNKGLIKNEEYTNARIKNPACGDDITVSTKVENGMVIDCKQQAAGCSISVASASVMTEIMIGKTKENALEIANTFLNMVSNQEYDQSIDLEEASASVMTEIMIGKTKENALEIANTFLNMVSNQEYDQSIDLEEAEVFGGVKQFPARIKCASIAWVAFKDTLSQE